MIQCLLRFLPLARQTRAGEPDPARCALIDDLPRTVRAARGLGWFSILYGRDDPGQDADAAFTRWADLPPILTGA